MIRTIKERLAAGEEVRVMVMGALASPKLAEMVGLMGGFHGLWIDQEHSAVPHQDLELILMACRASGLDAFARVPPTDYGTVMRPMEAGASGVMIAQIRTANQVREILAWAKYPPQGIRGVFMSNYEAGYATAPMKKHLVKANRDRWFCIQIETPEAVECADEIAAIDGVDCLFVGPSDLSCTLGVPGDVLHPKCIEAMDKVAQAVKAAGKSWGVLTRTAEHAARCREMGCQLFSLAGDMELVNRGLKATRDSYPEFFKD
jgi:2-dehydro-3-deoxyglucarate aldolase/4-hydroxy-2-oxoheptanedioate aldolase